MEEFVTQLALQNTDLFFEKDGKFKTIKNDKDFEKGNYTVNGKVITFEYIDGEKKDIEDMELLSISDSTLQLRNASNMVIDYKKLINKIK